MTNNYTIDKLPFLTREVWYKGRGVDVSYFIINLDMTSLTDWTFLGAFGQQHLGDGNVVCHHGDVEDCQVLTVQTGEVERVYV